jgi:hypothetical protein
MVPIAPSATTTRSWSAASRGESEEPVMGVRVLGLVAGFLVGYPAHLAGARSGDHPGWV